ncbi:MULTISPECIES: hypothetical protein [Methylobacterium]|uniref:hypothetical protein n=1 Tax=Methylobacterium TaxID=407 RepID=UPI000CC0BC09|nr:MULTISPECIES: hypothetical protein [Methylobacterium]PIU04476.1 MAG: hypothetical protein COT56_20045 [Methylobacterium sp. CG09_land_8_20_14_0_10_71_15]PIU13797.1 MAG: hypothetical protein COT28_10355 [Methylobacterium sp. CG08_land_8_20_14_0_20_71_15]GBU17137.1 hypothetical protein AwMethylo_13520 [Methylobacterium sp.]
MLHAATARLRLRAIISVIALYALVLQALAGSLSPAPATETAAICAPGVAAQDRGGPDRPEPHPACCLLHHAGHACDLPAPAAAALRVPRAADRTVSISPPREAGREPAGPTGRPRGPPLA